MGYPENRKKKGSLWKSFYYAFSGVRHAFSTERNLWIHSVISLCVILAAWYFRLARWEWITLLLTIATVIGMEMVNTAIESAIDLVTEEVHPLAKKAKDVAAGAVLVTVVASILVGIVVFLPHLI